MKETLLTRREWSRLAAASAAIGALGGCASQERSPAAWVENRSLDEMHKSALAEGGQLLVYGGGDLPNGAAGLEQAFARRFPGMKVRILVDRSKLQGVRIDNQLARGALQPDVVHILAHHYYDRWKAQGHLLPYKPLGWDQVFAEYRDPDAFWTPTSIFVFSTLVNTRVLPEAQAPRDWADFLDPGLKGKIALTHPEHDDSVLYQFDQAIAKHGWGWFDNLLKQDVLWIQGSGVNRQVVERGERAVSFNTSGPIVPAADSPVRFLLPRTDSFLSWAHPTAIFRRARHPEAAKLYVSWLLSPERQGTGTSWSVRQDMPTPRAYGPLSQYNTSPTSFRAALQDRVRLEQVRDMLRQAIGRAPDTNPTGVEGIFPEGMAS
ncbi:MAG TPA: extracellular solute-binding protein [Ramlibacter sp.]|jgi:ABC-type Fe3+ transport system substrate-binding protein|uniref:ABC transporter substrate-binding protein n=1 Tax=Ramlibacter sp. TaxID=1917967 RepID=UPI002D54572F|nr:extracellular solute-binding protein [Ramlibacter sp.]HZY19201.1 extracellular solute-binding protein [Ramlibacter sp.]